MTNEWTPRCWVPGTETHDNLPMVNHSAGLCPQINGLSNEMGPETFTCWAVPALNTMVNRTTLGRSLLRAEFLVFALLSVKCYP